MKTDHRSLSPKELAAAIDRLDFLIKTAADGTNTKEMERGLESYRSELRRREKLSRER